MRNNLKRMWEIEKIRDSLREFARMQKGDKHYREKRYRRNKNEIIGKVQDLLAGLKSNLRLSETRDCEGWGFYGFLRHFEQNSAGIQGDRKGRSEGHKEISDMRVIKRRIGRGGRVDYRRRMFTCEIEGMGRR